MVKIFSKLILSLLLIALIAAGAAGCTDNTAFNQDSADSSEITPTDIGAGQTAFRFEVIHSEASTTVWNVKTDQTTVGAALSEVGLIEGEVGAFGLEVKIVNGLKADYTEDGFFWAFHIDGEFAMTGADSTQIDEDRIYAFVHTPA